MNVSIVTEVRLLSYNNDFYVDSSFFKIIDRYKNAFGDINLFSRVVKSNKSKIKGLKKIPEGINLYDIKSIHSFVFGKINKDYFNTIINSNLIVLRVPSIVSLKIMKIVRKHNKKYMCEVMGCAFDAYWNHGLIGKIIAVPMYLMTRRIIRKSNYCLYVTEKFLQKRYPTKAYSVSASNVNIDKPRNIKDYSKLDRNNIILFTAAALNVKYKGQQFVIRTIKMLQKEGIKIDYYLAGKGDSKYLESVAKKFGVSERVHILGMLNKDEVNDMMLKTDIYVQPSLQEGLPRSLIEAMNCGLVCIGAKTAGIPELLNSRYVFKRGSSKAICKCIKSVINDDFEKIGRENMDEAEKYYSSILDNKRNNFYDKIKEDLSNNL